MDTRLTFSVALVLVLGLLGTSTAKGADPNLVGWWKFEEAGGTLYDQSDHHNDGTSFNGVLYQQPGREGYGLGFDGIDDYVVVGSAGRATNTFSFGGWIKTSVTHEVEGESTSGTGGTASQRYAFDPQHGGDLNGGAGLSVGTNGIAVYEHGSSYMPATAVYSAEIGSGWNHIMVVYSNKRPTIYLNGRAVRTGLSSPRAIVYAPIQLGGMAYGYLAGLMDEVRIYDRALSAAEIRELAFWPEAHNPDPSDGDTGVIQPLLTWTPGDGAALHDVYLGTNPTPGPAEYKVRTPYLVYWAGAVTPGTTYYWRIDEVEADGVTIHTGDVWSFTAAPSTAYNPVPADGARYVATDAELSWTAGVGAGARDVYFGKNEADVTNGTGGTLRATRQTGTTYDPGALAKDTVYYWRIDEFEAGGTKHTGAVWSFTTLPDIPITDPNLLGWWKLDEGFGTIAIDWSGHDNHGAINNPNGGLGAGGLVWYIDAEYGTVASFGGDNSSGAYVRAGSIPAMTLANDFTWTFWAKQDGDGTGVNDLIIGNRYGGTASPLQFIKFTPTNFEFYNGSLDGINYDDIPGGLWIHHAVVKDGTSFTYYRNGVNSGTNTIATTVAPNPFFIGGDAGGERWRGWLSNVRIYDRALTQQEIKQTMRADPLLAWDPSPANESTPDIDRATPLSWKPGDKAAQHDVYLGTDKIAVRDTDKSDTTGIYRGRQLAASYTPAEALQWGGGPYYWRIDEYNTDGTVSAGRVWSFTLADYLIVDDFEDYTDDVGSRIFQAWKDGWGYNEPPPGYAGNGTGSAVGYSQPPFAEPTTVHGGTQSMPLGYDNSGTGGKARYSEAFREWASAQDWTRYNVKALTLYFYGAAANAAEQLYVALEDNAAHVKVVNHLDPEAVQKAGWQEWNVELTQFSGAGVNLKAVKKMYIGLGNRTSPKAGGTGTIYIDDIRVYPSRCIPSFAKPAADLSGNCVVDQADVDILANLWLDSGFQVTPADPGTTGLIAHYPFNGNANDTVGGHNGTTVGTPTYAAGKIGQAIQLNGVDQMVDVGPVGVSGAAPRTIAGWAKSNSTAMPDWTNIFGFTGTDDANLSGRSFDIELRGGQLQFCIHVYGWEDNILPLDLDWHHLAATYDGTTIRWYGDGQYINSYERSGANALNTEDTVHMGRRGDSGEAGNFFPGKVDDVKIWNRALTAAQVAWLAGRTSTFSIPADLRQDNVINFKDFAVLADSWLVELLWP